MGLDTRAYAKATPEWQEAWVKRVNEQGWRTTMWGFARELIGKRNYGLTGGYLGGREPLTIEEAPQYHQDGLEDLPWPGGLIGGMISASGNAPSFRGKAYDSYVESITGKSLYAACEEYWDGEQLELVTRLLEAAAAVPKYPYLDVEQDERQALARWFRVCVEHDLAVSGDY